MTARALGRLLAGLALGLLLLAAPPATAATEIREIVSPGGLRLWFVEERSIPILSIEISFEGGATLDPEGKEGVTGLMAALLEEGAGDRDAVAFAEAAEALAVSFSFEADRDSVSVSARMLSETRDQAVALLREALVAPRLDAEAVERVRAQVISRIRSDGTDPDAIAGRAFYALAFPGDPYGRQETEAGVAALTRDDLRAAHRAALVRSRARIGVVGDIGAGEVGPLVDRLLGDLPAEGPPLPGPAVPDLPPGVTVIGFDTPQSVVLFGQPGIGRHDLDFFAAFVLNHILGGGGFSSRLTTEVRERRGLTYGVYSYLAGLDRADLWMGGVASANERVAEAIAVIRAEWLRIAGEGVTEAELRAAKQYLTGSYPLRFDTNGRIARNLVGLQEQGLPVDYVANRNSYVEAVTAEDVARVARRLVQAGGPRFVVVGRPVGLEPTE